ncbi:MAG: hypothetical protein AAGC95_02645 [Pseudomonadota bacterium]
MLALWHQLLGGTFIAAGMVMLPLPIPLGLLFLTIGLALMAPYVPAFQGVIRNLRTRYPRLDTSLVNIRDKAPPVIRTTIDKTKPL